MEQRQRVGHGERERKSSSHQRRRAVHRVRVERDDLVENFVDDSNGFNAIYVYDVSTGQNTLVSHAAGLPLQDPNGVQDGGFVINADGSRIAYRSRSTNLVAGFVEGNDTNTEADVYLWDATSNSSVLVSHTHDDPLQGQNDGANLFTEFELPLQISADGRYVAFTSRATDLVDGFIEGNSGLEDIYLFDANSGANTLVTHGATPVTGSNGENFRPVMSANGARVAYESKATNVADYTDHNAGATDVFVWSRSSNKARLVSFSATLGKKHGSDAPGGFNGSTPQISDNGKAIAYESDSNDLMKGFTDSFNGQDDIWLWTESTRDGRKVFKNTLVTHRFEDRKQSHFNPPNHMTALSGDGKHVVFQSGDSTQILEGFINNNGSNHDIYVWDAKTKKATLVSRSFVDPLNGSNGSNGAFPAVDVVSADGRVVPFVSTSTDIVNGFTNTNGALNDLYVFGPPTS